MTDIATDTIDLGRLAVIGESLATAENGLTASISAIDDAPELQANLRCWQYSIGVSRVVLVDVSDGSADANIIADHYTTSLATDPVESATTDAGAQTGSVLLIQGAAGPVMVGFVTTDPMPVSADRRVTSDSDLRTGLLSLGVLREVPLDVTAELGNTRLSVAEILQLTVGSIVELDRTAGSPVDVMVNGALIARGEVVVIEDEYGIRVTEIVGRIDDAI